MPRAACRSEPPPETSGRASLDSARRGEPPEALAHAQLEWDTPLYRMAVAQFDQAVPVAGIPDDVAERLRLSRALDDRLDSRPHGRRTPRRLPRLPRPALEHHRPDEGRDPLRPGGHARRVRGARDVDDVEVLAPAAAVRRREGRRALRPAHALARRARAPDAALHLGAPADHRPAGGHPGAGHGHERADDGLDDGHVLDAARLRRPGDRHREADLDRRLRLPPRGDRGRRRHGDRARLRAARLDARRPALRRPGLRQRRGDRRRRAARARRDGGRRVGRLRAACTPRPGSTSRALHAYAGEHGSLEGCDAGDAAHERRAARARLRHPRPRRARGPGHGRQRAARAARG